MQSLVRSFLAIVLFMSAGWAALSLKPIAPPLSTEPILDIHGSSLTTYLPSSATGVQDIWPRDENRGTNLDGSLRAAPTQGMAIAQIQVIVRAGFLLKPPFSLEDVAHLPLRSSLVSDLPIEEFSRT